MKKLLFASIFCLLIISNSLSLCLAETTATTHDNDIKNTLTGFATNGAGYQTADENTLVNTIANIVKIVIGLLSFIFLMLTIISGIQWMMAGGNDDLVKQAKARMKNAVIGLAITLLSFTISYYIFSLIRMSQDGSVSVPF